MFHRLPLGEFNAFRKKVLHLCGFLKNEHNQHYFILGFLFCFIMRYHLEFASNKLWVRICHDKWKKLNTNYIKNPYLKI